MEEKQTRKRRIEPRWFNRRAKFDIDFFVPDKELLEDFHKRLRKDLDNMGYRCVILSKTIIKKKK